MPLCNMATGIGKEHGQNLVEQDADWNTRAECAVAVRSWPLGAVASHEALQLRKRLHVAIADGCLGLVGNECAVVRRRILPPMGLKRFAILHHFSERLSPRRPFPSKQQYERDDESGNHARKSSRHQCPQSLRPIHEAERPLSNAAHLFISAENFTAL